MSIRCCSMAPRTTAIRWPARSICAKEFLDFGDKESARDMLQDVIEKTDSAEPEGPRAVDARQSGVIARFQSASFPVQGTTPCASR